MCEFLYACLEGFRVEIWNTQKAATNCFSGHRQAWGLQLTQPRLHDPNTFRIIIGNKVVVIAQSMLAGVQLV